MRSVGLYGTNLVMSIMGTILQKAPQFHVQQIDGLFSGLTEAANATWPEVILFDLATAPAHFAISVLQNHPRTVLVGVDLTTNKMLVLSGEQSCLVTGDDLVKVIDGGASSSEFVRGKVNGPTNLP